MPFASTKGSGSVEHATSFHGGHPFQIHRTDSLAWLIRALVRVIISVAGYGVQQEDRNLSHTSLRVPCRTAHGCIFKDDQQKKNAQMGIANCGTKITRRTKEDVAAVNRTRGSCMASTNFTTKPLRLIYEAYPV
jgi:copper homeostasis protein CutC